MRRIVSGSRLAPHKNLDVVSVPAKKEARLNLVSVLLVNQGSYSEVIDLCKNRAVQD